MSGDGPESIPTSADRRSRRPVKKRALTPVSAQAATVDALFAKPDQEIRVPTSAGAGSALVARRAAAPPEIISNVQGSSSGAGSGEFHVYKASRRREYARLRQLDEEARRDRDKTDFEAARIEREARDGDKTKRNREKREKAKARKAKAKTGGGGGAEGGGRSNGSSNAKNSQAAGAAAEEEARGKGTEIPAATAASASAPAAEKPPGEDVSEIPATAPSGRNGIFAPGSEAAAASNTGDRGNNSSSAQAVPQPVPIADGPGLLIHDDDDD